MAGTRRSIPTAEWIIAATGMVLVASMIAVLLREALSTRQGTPDIRVALLAVERQENAYVVRFSAINRGATTAADVLISGEVEKPDGAIERREATLDYVPSGSRVEGGLYFTSDPREGELRIRASGYRVP